jgi:hypothetical protein
VSHILSPLSAREHNRALDSYIDRWAPRLTAGDRLSLSYFRRHEGADAKAPARLGADALRGAVREFLEPFDRVEEVRLQGNGRGAAVRAEIVKRVNARWRIVSVEGTDGAYRGEMHVEWHQSEGRWVVTEGRLVVRDGSRGEKGTTTWHHEAGAWVFDAL